MNHSDKVAHCQHSTPFISHWSLTKRRGENNDRIYKFLQLSNYPFCSIYIRQPLWKPDCGPNDKKQMCYSSYHLQDIPHYPHMSGIWFYSAKNKREVVARWKSRRSKSIQKPIFRVIFCRNRDLSRSWKALGSNFLILAANYILRLMKLLLAASKLH